MKRPDSLTSTLVAPCGMDCVVCARHLRAKNGCAGCRSDDMSRPTYCAACRIRNCNTLSESGARFCFECPTYPCARLRRLDARYRARYGMSMIENLDRIRTHGMTEFVAHEKARWACPECGGVICVHKPDCVYCGRPRTDLTR